MTAKAIPEGYHTATPYLIIRGAAKAIDFYKRAFDAKEVFRMEAPDGRIGHAEIRIGDSHILLADEVPGHKGPQSLGGTSVSLLLYVNDVDKMFAAAVAAGASVQRAIQDQFYGDRSGTIADPFGHVWTIATHIEDVASDEMKRRAQQYISQQPKQAS